MHNKLEEFRYKDSQVNVTEFVDYFEAFLKEGKLLAKEKVRTKKKALKRLPELMEEYVTDGLEYSEKCYVSHSACLEDA